jgi:hypothetical protein
MWPVRAAISDVNPDKDPFSWSRQRPPFLVKSVFKYGALYPEAPAITVLQTMAPAGLLDTPGCAMRTLSCTSVRSTPPSP